MSCSLPHKWSKSVSTNLTGPIYYSLLTALRHSTIRVESCTNGPEELLETLAKIQWPLWPLLLEGKACNLQVWVKMDSLESRHRKSHEGGDNVAEMTITYSIVLLVLILHHIYPLLKSPQVLGVLIWVSNYCSLLQQGATPFCILSLFPPEWGCWFVLVTVLLLSNTSEESQGNRKWENIQSDSGCSVNLWS